MERKGYIEVEPYASLDTSGVHFGLFVGSDDSPSVEQTVKWEVLIDELLESYTVYGKKGIVLTMDSVDDVIAHLDGLIGGAEYFKEKLKCAQVFDREAWVKANNGEFNHDNFDEFTKELSDECIINRSNKR